MNASFVPSGERLGAPYVPGVASSDRVLPELSSQATCHACAALLPAAYTKVPVLEKSNWPPPVAPLAATSSKSGTGEPRVSSRAGSNPTPNNTP